MMTPRWRPNDAKLREIAETENDLFLENWTNGNSNFVERSELTGDGESSYE